MLRIGTEISTALLNHTNIATVEQQVGRAEQGEDTWGPHRSEFHVELKPLSGEEQAAMEKEIRGTLEAFPGVQIEVLTFLGDRIGATLPRETAPVVVTAFADHLPLLH